MLKTRDALTMLVAAAVVLGVGGRDRGASLELPNPVNALADQVTSGVRQVAANTAGAHLGFDTSKYPGDDAMTAWREDGSYEWVGYYLPAPCHKDDSWTGKRAMLREMGWGMAVVYVGQQTWGKTPGKSEVVTRYVRRRVKEVVRRHGRRTVHYVTRRVPMKVVIAPRAEPGSTCSAHFVSGARGLAEGDDAIARTEAEGFPRGTVIFLDVEHMNVIPRAMRDYYRQWVARVLQDGRYRPGIYAHTANAAIIYQDVRAVYTAAGVHQEPPFWIAGNTSDFTPDKLPTEVGHSFAAVWQGILDKVEERNGHKMPIDVNVAATPSPSTVVATD